MRPDSILGQRQVRVGIGILVAAKILLLFVLAWNTQFVMDEFVQFGWAKYLSNGLYTTIWPAKAVGYAVFFDLAHRIGWNAVSMLHIGRLETAFLACGTIALIYGCARSLHHSSLRALLVVLVMLSFSNIMERIFRTRAEPVALFWAAASLYVTLRWGARRRAIVAAGVLTGIAFITTQKSIYFNVALGLALAGDAALKMQLAEAIKRGLLLVFGWAVAVALYCVAFGGAHPLPVFQTLIFGPAPVLAPQVAADYGGLRHFVLQTLLRNSIVYLFCFAGMLLALLRIRRLDEATRIALIFSIVITGFVFAHDQPWPYVFVMALPFVALWSLEPFDALAVRDSKLIAAAAAVLGVAIAMSFVRDAVYLRVDNRDQLAIVSRAESLLAPDDVYFDATGMLPTRAEPSTLWLDLHGVLQTLHDRGRSEAYRIFSQTPPKLIIWSYRMDAIAPVVAPLVRRSYVQVAPNIRLAGARLAPGEQVTFDVPISGPYALYDQWGAPVDSALLVNGRRARAPLMLAKGPVRVALSGEAAGALFLLPRGRYANRLIPGDDNTHLFDGVYD